MISYEGYGNVLNHPIQTVTCPVNVVGVMGAGLAKDFRNRVGGLNQFYKDACENGTLAIGRPIVYRVDSTRCALHTQTQQILLFPTKGHWKRDSKPEYIEKSLKYLAEHYESMGITDLALPPLGCGLGQLDYLLDVRPLIDKHLSDSRLPVDILLRTD